MLRMAEQTCGLCSVGHEAPLASSHGEMTWSQAAHFQNMNYSTGDRPLTSSEEQEQKGARRWRQQGSLLRRHAERDGREGQAGPWADQMDVMVLAQQCRTERGQLT